VAGLRRRNGGRYLQGVVAGLQPWGVPGVGGGVLAHAATRTVLASNAAQITNER